LIQGQFIYCEKGIFVAKTKLQKLFFLKKKNNNAIKKKKYLQKMKGFFLEREGRGEGLHM
jgi:hypothetical protein